MVWRELVERIADETNIDEATVARVMRRAVDIVINTLADGDSVVLRRLGTLSSTWRGPRMITRITDGARVFIDGRHTVKFTAGRPLKAALAGRTPQTSQLPGHQDAWQHAEQLLDSLVAENGVAPPSLRCPPGDDAAILAGCIGAYGERWTQLETAYHAQVDPAVATQRDYLAVAAYRRWGRV